MQTEDGALRLERPEAGKHILIHCVLFLNVYVQESESLDLL